jgi:hypothetical protein
MRITLSGSQRRSPTRSITRPANGCVTCRSRSINYSRDRVIGETGTTFPTARYGPRLSCFARRTAGKRPRCGRGKHQKILPLVVIRRNHDRWAPVHIPLEYRTAKELRAMAEHLRTAADANTQSMQVWTELLALAAYYDNLADQVADCSVSTHGMREVRSGAPSSTRYQWTASQGQRDDDGIA